MNRSVAAITRNTNLQLPFQRLNVLHTHLKSRYSDLSIAAVGFTASLILTWMFIDAFDGYISNSQMMLSGVIAGGKWAIQLLLAAALLGDKRWCYFREMGVVCGVGSLVLIPYILFQGNWTFFVGSLVCCMVVMAYLVLSRLALIGVSGKWATLWFLLLGIAVSLQLFLVFDVVG